MTKQELIARSSAISGLTQAEIRQCVAPFIQALSEAFLEGETVAIRGLGTFLIKDYPERKSHNPRTGEAIIVPPNIEFVGIRPDVWRRKKVLYKETNAAGGKAIPVAAKEKVNRTG